MFDTAFVNHNYISRISALCEECPELRVVYITDDVPTYLVFNAAYWPERALCVVRDLVKDKD